MVARSNEIGGYVRVFHEGQIEWFQDGLLSDTTNFLFHLYNLCMYEKMEHLLAKFLYYNVGSAFDSLSAGGLKNS